MSFRGGMNELMRQAARLQRKVEAAKKEAESKEVVVSSAGDRVKVTATYGGRVQRIEIDPAFVQSEGLELALDAACAAVNSALEQAEKAMEAEVDKVTGGVKIPGL
jgi:DNA-binding YbaB/EbfC family protein